MKPPDKGVDTGIACLLILPRHQPRRRRRRGLSTGATAAGVECECRTGQREHGRPRELHRDGVSVLTCPAGDGYGTPCLSLRSLALRCWMSAEQAMFVKTGPGTTEDKIAEGEASPVSVAGTSDRAGPGAGAALPACSSIVTRRPLAYRAYLGDWPCRRSTQNGPARPHEAGAFRQIQAGIREMGAAAAEHCPLCCCDACPQLTPRG